MGVQNYTPFVKNLLGNSEYKFEELIKSVENVFVAAEAQSNDLSFTQPFPPSHPNKALLILDIANVVLTAYDLASKKFPIKLDHLGPASITPAVVREIFEGIRRSRAIYVSDVVMQVVTGLLHLFDDRKDIVISLCLDGNPSLLKTKAKKDAINYDQSLFNLDLEFLGQHEAYAIERNFPGHNEAITYKVWVREEDAAVRTSASIRRMTKNNCEGFKKELKTKLDKWAHSLRAADVFSCMEARYPSAQDSTTRVTFPAPGGNDPISFNDVQAGARPIGSFPSAHYLELHQDQATKGRSISEEDLSSQSMKIKQMVDSGGIPIFKGYFEAENAIRFVMEGMDKAAGSSVVCIPVSADSDFLAMPFPGSPGFLIRTDPKDKATPSRSNPYHSRKFQLVDLENLIRQTDVPRELHHLLAVLTNRDEVNGLPKHGLISNHNLVLEVLELLTARRIHLMLSRERPIVEEEGNPIGIIDDEGYDPDEEGDANVGVDPAEIAAIIADDPDLDVQDWTPDQEERWKAMNAMVPVIRGIENPPPEPLGDEPNPDTMDVLDEEEEELPDGMDIDAASEIDLEAYPEDPSDPDELFDSQDFLTNVFALLYSRNFPLEQKVIDAAVNAQEYGSTLSEENRKELCGTEMRRVRSALLEMESGKQEPVPPLRQPPPPPSNRIALAFKPDQHLVGKVGRTWKEVDGEGGRTLQARYNLDESRNPIRDLPDEQKDTIQTSLKGRSHPVSSDQSRRSGNFNRDDPRPKVSPIVTRASDRVSIPGVPLKLVPEAPKVGRGITKGAAAFQPKVEQAAEDAMEVDTTDPIRPEGIANLSKIKPKVPSKSEPKSNPKPKEGSAAETRAKKLAASLAAAASPKAPASVKALSFGDAMDTAEKENRCVGRNAIQDSPILKHHASTILSADACASMNLTNVYSTAVDCLQRVTRQWKWGDLEEFQAYAQALTKLLSTEHPLKVVAAFPTQSEEGPDFTRKPRSPLAPITVFRPLDSESAMGLLAGACHVRPFPLPILNARQKHGKNFEDAMSLYSAHYVLMTGAASLRHIRRTLEATLSRHLLLRHRKADLLRALAPNGGKLKKEGGGWIDSKDSAKEKAGLEALVSVFLFALGGKSYKTKKKEFDLANPSGEAASSYEEDGTSPEPEEIDDDEEEVDEATQKATQDQDRLLASSTSTFFSNFGTTIEEPTAENLAGLLRNSILRGKTRTAAPNAPVSLTEADEAAIRFGSESLEEFFRIFKFVMSFFEEEVKTPLDFIRLPPKRRDVCSAVVLIQLCPGSSQGEGKFSFGVPLSHQKKVVPEMKNPPAIRHSISDRSLGRIFTSAHEPIEESCDQANKIIQGFATSNWISAPSSTSSSSTSAPVASSSTASVTGTRQSSRPSSAAAQARAAAQAQAQAEVDAAAEAAAEAAQAAAETAARADNRTKDERLDDQISHLRNRLEENDSLIHVYLDSIWGNRDVFRDVTIVDVLRDQVKPALQEVLDQTIILRDHWRSGESKRTEEVERAAIVEKLRDGTFALKIARYRHSLAKDAISNDERAEAQLAASVAEAEASLRSATSGNPIKIDPWFKTQCNLLRNEITRSFAHLVFSKEENPESQSIKSVAQRIRDKKNSQFVKTRLFPEVGPKRLLGTFTFQGAMAVVQGSRLDSKRGSGPMGKKRFVVQDMIDLDSHGPRTKALYAYYEWNSSKKSYNKLLRTQVNFSWAPKSAAAVKPFMKDMRARRNAVDPSEYLYSSLDCWLVEEISQCFPKLAERKQTVERVLRDHDSFQELEGMEPSQRSERLNTIVTAVLTTFTDEVKIRKDDNGNFKASPALRPHLTFLDPADPELRFVQHNFRKALKGDGRLDPQIYADGVFAMDIGRNADNITTINPAIVNEERSTMYHPLVFSHKQVTRITKAGNYRIGLRGSELARFFIPDSPSGPLHRANIVCAFGRKNGKGLLAAKVTQCYDKAWQEAENDIAKTKKSNKIVGFIGAASFDGPSGKGQGANCSAALLKNALTRRAGSLSLKFEDEWLSSQTPWNPSLDCLGDDGERVLYPGSKDPFVQIANVDQVQNGALPLRPSFKKSGPDGWAKTEGTPSKTIDKLVCFNQWVWMGEIRKWEVFRTLLPRDVLSTLVFFGRPFYVFDVGTMPDAPAYAPKNSRWILVSKRSRE